MQGGPEFSLLTPSSLSGVWTTFFRWEGGGGGNYVIKGHGDGNIWLSLGEKLKFAKDCM